MAYSDDSDPSMTVSYERIASVLDGQHRIAGLKGFKGSNGSFDINVSIFLELDPSSEAYIFSVVNQAQTKVNRSLVYDLYSLATSRSPQRLCHQIAVTLNQEVDSPFKNRIKRLGSASPLTRKIAITQAAFVESLMNLISAPHALAVEDRDRYMRGKKPRQAVDKEIEKLIFRQMMIDEKDDLLTVIIWNYFDAVSQRWREAWMDETEKFMLAKTNGFTALMKFLRDIYVQQKKIGEMITTTEFLGILNKIDLNDRDFTTDNFKPGTSGASRLHRCLKAGGLVD
jgi:DGQHR domain-containing protein